MELRWAATTMQSKIQGPCLLQHPFLAVTPWTQACLQAERSSRSWPLPSPSLTILLSAAFTRASTTTPKRRRRLLSPISSSDNLQQVQDLCTSLSDQASEISVSSFRFLPHLQLTEAMLSILRLRSSGRTLPELSDKRETRRIVRERTTPLLRNSGMKDDFDIKLPLLTQVWWQFSSPLSGTDPPAPEHDQFERQNSFGIFPVTEFLLSLVS